MFKGVIWLHVNIWNAHVTQTPSTACSVFENREDFYPYETYIIPPNTLFLYYILCNLVFCQKRDLIVLQPIVLPGCLCLWIALSMTLQKTTRCGNWHILQNVSLEFHLHGKKEILTGFLPTRHRPSTVLLVNLNDSFSFAQKLFLWQKHAFSFLSRSRIIIKKQQQQNKLRTWLLAPRKAYQIILIVSSPLIVLQRFGCFLKTGLVMRMEPRCDGRKTD